MNRLVRALVGVVVAKAAVAAGWYLYQKSTEQENDWKTEGEPEVKEDVKPVAVTPAPVVEKAPEVEPVKPAVKKTTPRVKKEVVKAEEAPKAKRVRKPAVKKATPAPAVETKVPVKKTTRSRAKKAE